VKNIFKSESSQVIAFVAVIFISRVPFLFSGYGLDADAWEVALTAKHISETGVYEVSRFPGYPVHELICSLFYNGSYVALNLLTTIISTFGFLFFAYTLKALRFKSVFLASFALASVPVIYIHSTTTIDYTWALAFILISFYFIVKDKPVIAGLFLGIAIGCRITSGAMLLPFLIMLSQNAGTRTNLIRLARFILATCLFGTIFFLPVLFKYGIGFFTYYDAPYPSIPKVLYKFTFEVWGIVGLLGLLISTGLLFLPNTGRARKYLFPRSVNEKYVVAWLVAIDLYIIAFLKLPMESGYLVPMVPFVILIFGKYLFEKAFTFFAIALIASPLIAGIAPAGKTDSPGASPLAMTVSVSGENLLVDPVIGPVFSYQSRRINAMKFTEQFLQSLNTIHNKTFFICGRWYTQVALSEEDVSNASLRFTDYADRETIRDLISKGYDIYYLPEQDYFNEVKYGYDVKSFGALPFTVEEN
jgi:hypothetical protein